MGNLWTGRDRAKLMEAELKMFTMPGLSEADIEQKDIYLDGDENGQNFIHYVTVKGKREGLQKVVMIHGYGGGGGVFTKMTEHMQQYYEVITMDLLGMGASGRPDFTCITYEECVDFFMTSIKRWVELTGIAKE